MRQLESPLGPDQVSALRGLGTSQRACPGRGRAGAGVLPPSFVLPRPLSQGRALFKPEVEITPERAVVQRSSAGRQMEHKRNTPDQLGSPVRPPAPAFGALALPLPATFEDLEPWGDTI